MGTWIDTQMFRERPALPTVLPRFLLRNALGDDGVPTLRQRRSLDAYMVQWVAESPMANKNGLFRSGTRAGELEQWEDSITANMSLIRSHSCNGFLRAAGVGRRCGYHVGTKSPAHTVCQAGPARGPGRLWVRPSTRSGDVTRFFLQPSL